jgi:hypothetical protein
LGLKDQSLKHRHRIERRPPALGPVAVTETFDQPAAEIFEIHRGIQDLKRIAVPAQRLKLLRQSEKVRWSIKPPPDVLPGRMNQIRAKAASCEPAWKRDPVLG